MMALVFTLALFAMFTVSSGWQSQPRYVKLMRQHPLSVVNLSSPSTTCTEVKNTLHQNKIESPQMIPLANPPLLLLQSASQIINPHECNLLSRFFEQVTDSEESKAAEAILHRVKEIIDEVTNCPRHAGEMQIPRYARYDAKCISMDELLSEDFVDKLLPDGLHVDTNNGKLFRHATAILYLTDNDESDFVVGGGTTFPLAVPYGSLDDSTLSWTYAAAGNILSENMHHTKATDGESQKSDQRCLEQSATEMFYKDISRHFGLSQRIHIMGRAAKNGIRVMPEAGKLIYFHNIGDDGRPDPTSFHGGEELAQCRDRASIDFKTKDHKSILVFFKEIPVDKIKDLDTFAEEVRRAREWTFSKYYSHEKLKQ